MTSVKLLKMATLQYKITIITSLLGEKQEHKLNVEKKNQRDENIYDVRLPWYPSL